MKINIKVFSIIAIVFLSILTLGCVETQPSAPTSIDNPKSTVVSTPVPTQAQTQKNIIITYSAKKLDSIGAYGEAKTGRVFLVITMNIENQGYKEFSLNPFYFNLIANNIKYNTAPESYSMDDKLETVDLLDGGTIKGSLAFDVPSNIGSYQLQYSGFQDYEIVYKTT